MRIVIPNAPHHVALRGVCRRNMLRSDMDHHELLAEFRAYAKAGRIHVLAYCLMPDHLQAVLVPPTSGALSGFVSHFPAMPRSCFTPIDPINVWTAIRHIECDPVRAGIAEQASEYHWSSAVAHIWSVDMRGILDMYWWWNQTEGMNWRAYLETEPEPLEIYTAVA